MTMACRAVAVVAAGTGKRMGTGGPQGSQQGLCCRGGPRGPLATIVLEPRHPGSGPCRRGGVPRVHITRVGHKGAGPQDESPECRSSAWDHGTVPRAGVPRTWDPGTVPEGVLTSSWAGYEVVA